MFSHITDSFKLGLMVLCMAFFPLQANAAIRMAITMDDLPLRYSHSLEESPLSVVRQTVAIFKKHRVPEVYGFINAVRLNDAPKEISQLRYWRKAGYPLGNHTYSHTDFNHVPLAAYETEIEKNEPVLRKLAGATDWKLFRFPYLSYGPPEKREALFSYLQQRGYRTAYTSLDFQDWRWIDPYLRCKKRDAHSSIRKMKQLYMENALDSLERTEAISHVLFNRDVPYILLLHISEFNVHMLDELLSEYEKRGVTFITLDEALKDPVYQQFGLYADKLNKQYNDSDVWQSWRGPISLPGLTLDVYEDRPAEKLASVCL